MNTKLILVGLLLSGIILLYSLNIDQSLTGPRGGELKRAESFNIEMLSAFPNLYVYLFDQKLQPINNKNVSCEIKFFFPDETSKDLNLKPFEKYGFVIETSKMAYHACKVTLNVSGKPVSAMFDKESSIVKK